MLTILLIRYANITRRRTDHDANVKSSPKIHFAGKKKLNKNKTKNEK